MLNVLRSLGFGLLLTGSGLACVQAVQLDTDTLFDMDLEQLLQVRIEVAARRPQTLTDAAAIVTAFSRTDIERMGVTSLIDVLKHSPALETSLDPDGHWRIAVRGLRKDGDVLLLINGQAFNDLYDGHALFDLPVALVERVEVIRGPGSALYGSNAVVGVINVITRQQAGISIIGGGSHNSAGMAGSLALGEGGPGRFLGAGYQRTDGANQSLRTGAVNLESQGSSSRWLRDAWLGLGYQQDDWQWQMLVLDRARGAWSGATLQAIADDSDLAERSLRSHVSYQWQLTPHLLLRPNLQLGWQQHDFLLNEAPPKFEVSGVIFPDGAYTSERYETLAMGTDSQLQWQATDNFYVLAGVVYDQQKMLNYDLQRNYRAAGPVPESGLGHYDLTDFEQDHVTRNLSAVYVQSEATWQQWSLTLGGRYDHYSDFGSSSSPRLGLVFHAKNNLTFKALHAEAFRAPTLKELYDHTRLSNDGYVGNTALRPETTATTELAAEWTIGNWLLRGNAFRQNIDDLIAIYDPEGTGGIGRYDNIGAIRGRGAEGEIIWNATRGTQLYFNASRFENDFSWDSAARFDGDRAYLQSQGETRLYNSPRLRVNTGIKTSYDRWSGFLGINYGARTVANNRSVLEGFRAFRERQVRIGAYRQIDFSVSWQQNEQLQWSLLGNNLYGDKYSDPEDGLLIDRFGLDGLLQPGDSYELRVHLAW